ncbi:MAG: hypothetical protein COW87_04585, partial [Candidatus Levybacteria bacterium CG22_combo_CG10-13_8_21_14_all_35_11]
VYKAVLVDSDVQFLYLSKYIHRQALSRLQGEALEAQVCSFGEYLGKRKTEWIFPDEILDSFSKNTDSLSYEKFVLEEEDYKFIENLTIEE